MFELKTHSATSVTRALTILEIVAESKRGRTLAEIARLLEIPKSSAHRLLLTLRRSGYLCQQRETNRYRWSSKFFSFATITPSGLELNDMTTSSLHALMEQTRMTIHLALLERDEAILVRKVEPPGPLRLATWVGKRMGMNCTGVGKAILAHLPEERLSRMIQERPMPRHNENTIVSARKLGEQLCQVIRLGYAIDNEEDEIGLRCIGSPILDQAGRVLGAISIAGTINQITPESISVLAEKVKHTGAMISKQMNSVREYASNERSRSGVSSLPGLGARSSKSASDVKPEA